MIINVVCASVCHRWDVVARRQLSGEVLVPSMGPVIEFKWPDVTANVFYSLCHPADPAGSTLTFAFARTFVSLPGRLSSPHLANVCWSHKSSALGIQRSAKVDVVLFTWFPELTEGQDINPRNESKMRNEDIEGRGTRCSDSTDWAEKGAGNISPRPVVWKKDVEYVAKMEEGVRRLFL